MTKTVASGIRTKTKLPGVFWRYGKDRLCADGKPDVCYDILYKDADGKQKMEKVGWRSEGITQEHASQERSKRILDARSTRNAELISGPTLADAWKVYKENWSTTLRAGRVVVTRFERYLLPVFGETPMTEIAALDIDRLKGKLLTEKSVRGRPGLTQGTVRTIMADLRRVLRKAKEWGLYTGEIPAFHLPPSDDKRERFLSRDEAVHFLDELQLVECDLYYIAKISLFTGMRLGEILDMQIQDINLSAGTIHIEGKTGKRFAYISDSIKCDFENLVSRANCQFLFTREKGQKYRHAYISARFSKIISAMGMNTEVTESRNKFVFHTLRHTFCSWLAIKGVPLFTIGKLVGHSTLEMTQRYSKLSPDSKRTALSFIDETLRG